MLCLSSIAFSVLNESIRVSNAESQLALPLSTTTFFGVSVMGSPNGSAAWTGAAGGGAGVCAAAGLSAGDLSSAGGGAGTADGAGVGVGVVVVTGGGELVCTGAGVAGVPEFCGGTCAQAK